MPRKTNRTRPQHEQLNTLAAALPWLAIAVRRLHDTNRSGWWVLLYLVPFGNVVLLVFTTLPSDERGARFDRA